MAFRLERLRADLAIVDREGRPTADFQRWWQTQVEKIEAQETAQDAILVALNATTNRIRRINSHTLPTSILTATDNGATATITVADHTRIYADGTTQAITGGSQSGLASGTNHAIYYDDATLADPAPTLVFTTTVTDAQAAAGEGRHFLGMIQTPAAGSGKTYTGGGAYPAGSSIGGEV